MKIDQRIQREKEKYLGMGRLEWKIEVFKEKCVSYRISNFGCLTQKLKQPTLPSLQFIIQYTAKYDQATILTIDLMFQGRTYSK